MASVTLDAADDVLRAELHMLTTRALLLISGEEEYTYF
jgi:hypothetical protein